MADNDLKSGRLDSWKDIAAYVGRDVRTVIRWENQKGLPVHRIPGGRRKAVFAYTEEIDRWRRGGQFPEEPEKPIGVAADLPESSFSEPAVVAQKSLVSRLLWSGGSLLLLVAGSALAYRSFDRPRPIQITAISQITNDGVEKQGLIVDGTTLYFSEFIDGRMRLKKMAIQGGAIESIDTPIPNALPVDVSADGTELLAFDITGPETEHPLWVVSLRSGGSSHRVGDIMGHSATWSPDGKEIAYAEGNSIYLTTDAGNNSRQLVSLGGIPTRLHWSDDGSRLLLILENTVTGWRSPWEIALDSGKSMRALSSISLPMKDCCEAWSRETQKGIYFLAPEDRAGPLWALFNRKTWWNERFDWIPLKVQLSNHLEVAAAPGHDEIFAMSSDVSQAELLLFDPATHEFKRYLPGISATYADFSPDGQLVTYERTTDQTLWVSRADGTQAHQIKFAMNDVELPRWSPDGRRIAFMARRDGNPWRVYIATADGAHVEEASAGDDNQGAPTWSPDGHAILYANVECQTTHSCAIHRINLGTHETDVLSGSQGMRTARWSPDGRYVAALNQGTDQLCLYDFARQQWRKLADDATGDDVSWSHDSRYVYMSRPTGNVPAIVRVPVPGGREEPVVDLRPWDGAAGTYAAAWFSLAPHGAILIGHADHQPEIFALHWGN